MHTACSKSKIRTQTPPDLLEGWASVKTQWYFSLNPVGTSKQQLTFSNSGVRQPVWAPRRGALAIQRQHRYKTIHMGRPVFAYSNLQNISTSLPNLCKHLSESAWTHRHGERSWEPLASLHRLQHSCKFPHSDEFSCQMKPVSFSSMASA